MARERGCGVALATVWVAAGLWCAGLIACVRTPYQVKQDAQATQVERLRPAELAHERGGWRALRTMHVRLYVDARAAEGSGRADFEERLSRANELLGSALRLRLVLEDVRALPPELSRASDNDSALVRLEQLDPAKDVELVVAVIGAAPVVTLSFHELGRARVLGKHVVLRSMDDAAELKALEGFDTLDATERSRLYQQRKRHKETAVFLHEVGHTLGALHTREQLDLMHATYDDDMQGFAPANLELMTLVVDERLADADARDDRGLVRRLAEHLRSSKSDAWVEAERQSYLSQLEGAIEPDPKAAGASAGSQQPAAARAEPDLPGVSEADRARLRELDQAAEQKRWDDVRAAITELGRAYPDSYPVQEKVCKMAMRLRLTARDLEPYCDGMMKLSMQRDAR